RPAGGGSTFRSVGGGAKSGSLRSIRRSEAEEKLRGVTERGSRIETPAGCVANRLGNACSQASLPRALRSMREGPPLARPGARLLDQPEGPYATFPARGGQAKRPALLDTSSTLRRAQDRLRLRTTRPAGTFR